MEYTINSNAVKLDSLDIGLLFTFRDSSNKLKIPVDNLCMTCKRDLEIDLVEFLIIDLNTGTIYNDINVYQEWVYLYKQQSPIMLKVV